MRKFYVFFETPDVFDTRCLLWRFAAIMHQHRTTHWKKDKIYQFLDEFVY